MMHKIFLVWCGIAYAFALALAFFFDLSGMGIAPMGFGQQVLVEFVLLTALAFVAAMLFFGKATPLTFLYFGLAGSEIIVQNFFLGILLFVPLALAAYAGTYAGRCLEDDFKGEGNFFEHKGNIILYLASAFLVAAAISALEEYILRLSELVGQYWGRFYGFLVR